MRTELFEKIVSQVKIFLGLSPESTEAEIHEKLVNASEDVKADLVVNVANQIAVFAADEINKRADEIAAQIKEDSNTMIEMLKSSIEELKTEIETLKSNQPTTGVSGEQLSAAIESAKSEIGAEILNFKSQLTGQPNAAGEGKLIETHKSKTDKPVIMGVWGQKPKALESVN